MPISIYEKIHKISKTFPNSPGVYFFLGEKTRRRQGYGGQRPIYIGRAGSLKKRIASYFRTKDPRISEMVQLARGLKFEKTKTLLEAIILEANMIKKYWPKYNVQEKDNKSFDYLVITNPSAGSGRGENYPKVLTVRGRELEKYLPRRSNAKAGGVGGLKIFGPYQSYRLLRTALGLVRRIFPFGKCSPGQGKPCFDQQIGLCPGICVDAISQKDYKKNIDNIALFFGGQRKRLLKNLKKQNPEKIKALEQVNDVALLQGRENITTDAVVNKNKRFGDKSVFGRIEGYDISHLSGKNPVGAMVVFEGGEKNPSQNRLFKIKNFTTDAVVSMRRNYNDLAMLREVLERRLNHKEWTLPDIVFVDGGLNQVKAAKEILNKRNIFVPIVGLAKIGGHSASAYTEDKLIIANTKKSNRDLLITSKKIFQAVRNEAHRFAINFNRRQTKNL